MSQGLQSTIPIVDNIVLMGPVALGYREESYYQAVTLPILYAQQILDHNHNGFISVHEALKDCIFHFIPINLTQALTQNITTIDGTTEQLNHQYNMNNDTFISINDELKPRLIDQLRLASVVTQDEKCGLKPCPIWLKSQYSAIPNLDIISKVPFNTSILILNGKDDSQTPIQHALLLQQKLMQVRHPDHTLITYPDLGHLFYPSSQWITVAGGSMEPKVLEDSFSLAFRSSQRHQEIYHYATRVKW